jgi:hypothetical protein
MQRMAPGVIARAAPAFARHGLRRPPPSLISGVRPMRALSLIFAFAFFLQDACLAAEPEHDPYVDGVTAIVRLHLAAEASGDTDRNAKWIDSELAEFQKRCSGYFAAARERLKAEPAALQASPKSLATLDYRMQKIREFLADRPLPFALSHIHDTIRGASAPNKWAVEAALCISESVIDTINAQLVSSGSPPIPKANDK